MNPDTRLTDAQMRWICDRHNLLYVSHCRITTGFTHEVHRLNDDLVIKFFNADSPQRFATESAILGLPAAFPKPQLVASGGPDEVVDRSYVIMTYVPGRSLGSCWHMATDDQREHLIQQISRALQTINTIQPADIALQAERSWQDFIVDSVHERLDRLKGKDIIDAATTEKVLHTLTASALALADSELYVVYWDIHFDNFIVDDDFRLQAVIDLENVALTALDYPLFVVQKQMTEPEKYLREADEQYADKKDYEQLQNWYRQYYPEMFAVSHLDTRLRVYQLLDTLHLLADWPHVQSLHAKLAKLLA